MHFLSPASIAAPDEASTVDIFTARIDALLPQTQCRRCGFDGCLPYAAALARNQTTLNRCPPGGSAGIAALAALLEREPLPLDPACGTAEDPGVAWIDPERCIGCARCLPPCPVDAILGAQRYLHTVIDALCNGCELCLAACPVDCIDMQPRSAPQRAPSTEENRSRYAGHQLRAARLSTERDQLLDERKHRIEPSP